MTLNPALKSGITIFWKILLGIQYKEINGMICFNIKNFIKNE